MRPVYDVVDPQDNNIFQANADGDAATDIRPLFVDRDLRNTNIDDEFWTVFLLGSYQHTLDEDSDPSTEDLTLGIVDAITLVSDDLEGSAALIFTEGHRPREVPGYTPNPTNLSSMAVTVAHEVGHLFSSIHDDNGVMGDDPVTGNPVSNQYSPRTIRKIRTLRHP